MTYGHVCLSTIGRRLSRALRMRQTKRVTMKHILYVVLLYVIIFVVYFISLMGNNVVHSMGKMADHESNETLAYFRHVNTDINTTQKVEHLETNATSLRKITFQYLMKMYSNKVAYKRTHPNDTSNLLLDKGLHMPTVNTGCNEQFYRSHMMRITSIGRLGNQMFQYAMLIATAWRYCYKVYTTSDTMAGLKSTFNIPGLPLGRNFVRSNLELYEQGAAIYDTRVDSLNTSANWSFCCYMQSWRYFAHAHPLIRSAFIFKDNIQHEVVRFVQHVVKPSENLTQIGVHVRRMDMAARSSIEHGYIAADITYIQKAMKYFRNNFSERIFIIVSDDMKWCKTAIKGSDVVFSSFKSAALDLALLAQCDHVIITTGTFGWWGAWLSGGIVVYFAGYPIPGTFLAGQTNATDYYPPYWLGLQ